MKGQAKKDFEKWYKEQDHITNIMSTYWYFSKLPPSMQHGVIVDWFDSVGIDLDGITIVEFMFMDKPRDRHQARQKAIDKAVEIYNKR